MVHKNFSEPLQTYMSRGQRIMSVLNGDFDPNAYSRMDKFDGLEVGQELVDSALDSRPADKASSKKTATSAEGTINQSEHSGD